MSTKYALVSKELEAKWVELMTTLTPEPIIINEIAMPEWVRKAHQGLAVYDNCFHNDKGFYKTISMVPFHEETGDRLWFKRSNQKFYYEAWREPKAQ